MKRHYQHRLINTSIFILSFAGPTNIYAANCSNPAIHCVSKSPGSNQEYTSIQSAVDSADAGEEVWVYNGDYAGFVVEKSASKNKRINVIAKENNVKIVSSYNDGGKKYGILIYDSSYITISGFIINNSNNYMSIAARGATPTDPMYGLTIKNNKLSNAVNTNLYLSEVSNSLIEGNVVSGAQQEHGIYLANAGSDNTTLRNNVIFGNQIEGIHMNGDESVGGDGVITGLLIENNTIYDNGQNGMNMDGVRNSTIQNNLVFDNASRALRAYRIDGSKGPANFTIVNNTFITNGGWAIKFTQDGGGHTLFNNILLVNSGGDGSLCLDNPNFKSNYNIMVNRLAYKAQDGDCKVISLAKWQQQTNQDIKTQLGDMTIFENPSNSDFSLSSNSTAIDSGTNSFNDKTIPSGDIEGKIRVIGSKPDIGAYESGEPAVGTRCTPEDIVVGPVNYISGEVIKEQAEGSLGTSGSIILQPGARVTYEASTSIALNSGFYAYSGSQFSATVTSISCPSGA